MSATAVSGSSGAASIDIITRLKDLLQSQTGKKLLRAHVYTVPLQQQPVAMTSNQKHDYAYKKDPCPFPTRARGLFTSDDRIVVRGYDKFFNVGEVSWTKWEAIAQQARGPYHLTVKSNGCLILISALSPHQLIVTSKHAIGPSAAAAQGIPSHAEMGEDWVKRSITKAGRTEQQLAKQLWDNNWTAVAELCDDSFEEHVLPYSQEKTGLHLHGLNLNTAELGTVPPQRVNEFAKEFGFIETRFLTLDSVDEVKHFTDACSADNGRWNGEHVEGFVVRSPRQNATEESLETFMFKVKFEQPYLRWREWREITRKMLAFVRKQPPNPSLTTASEDPGVIFGVNTKKIQHPDTKAYALWVSDQMKADLGQFDEWQHGRGIVKTRDRFLEWLAQNPHPANRAANSDPTSGKDTRPFDRTLIVPVAVPGCGKTLMANALTEIFGFAHTQSDDVQAKQTKKQFLANISKLLKTETVVIADRNNHQRLHRRDVADAAANKALTNHRVRKIALAFTVSKVAGNLVHNTCADRIAHRGERHQSLRADTETMAHEAVLSKFLTEFETFDPVMNGDSDGRYDDVIEVDPCLEAKPMLDLIVQRLTELMPDLVVPASKAMDAALEKALSYDPAIRKESKLGVGEVRYYAISVEADLCTLLERHFSNVADHLYHQLKSEGRIERRPHITLVHHKEVEGGDAEAKTTWHNAQQLSKRFGADAVVMQVQLGPRIAWNERVMAIEAHLVDPPDDVQGILRHRSTFHITIGTANREIPAVEGKWITQAMLAGQNKTEDGLAVISASVGSYVFQGRVRGMN